MNKLFFIIFCSLIYLSSCAKIKVKPETNSSCLKRPCKLDDLSCIRREFHKRGWCKNLNGTSYHKGALAITEFKYDFATLNTTTYNKVALKGLHRAQIAEFYLNKKNGAAVFAIRYYNYKAKGEVVVHYHRDLKEDLVAKLPCHESYSRISITSVIPAGKCFSDDITYNGFLDSDPIYDIGLPDCDDKWAKENPEMYNLLKTALGSSDSLGSVIFKGRSPAIMKTYVENVICAKIHKKVPASVASAESAISESASLESASLESVTSEPATSESATSESAKSEPATSESATSEPATSEPATSESATSAASLNSGDINTDHKT